MAQLIEIGKARFGGNKPMPAMNGRIQQISAYEFLV